MKIYTKGGDAGITNLVHTKNISKSDDRIALVGTVDELTSNLGLVKLSLKEGGIPEGEAGKALEVVEGVQRNLITLMAGVADPYNREYHLPEELVSSLEEEIDRLEGLFSRPKEFILPGACPLSARLDVARTVARRAERALALVSVRFGADAVSKKYLNRLADYLYVLARYADSVPEEAKGQRTEGAPAGGSQVQAEDLIREVLRRVRGRERISLSEAKRLMQAVEEEAVRRGLKAVIAVCGPEGNPIGVHVMDGAFLVSFDVATKKAYTAVAVKMSTMELSKMAAPGGTFYGLDKMDGGRIVIFGGGVPLKVGDTIIGGLGISGGTGEEDHGLAEYALGILDQVLEG